MNRILAVAFLFLISCQAPINQETISLDGENVLVGEIDWEGLTTSPYRDWFVDGYKNYHVDTLTLADLTESMENTDILLFMGSWCEDSQIEVPQFYKILDHIRFDLEHLTTIALEKQEDGKLVSPQQQESGWDIGFVPTIIFIHQGVEIGRITEYPQRSLEKDMTEIINRAMTD